jgi:uncharacterized tellurite resistance protein B-like protein
MLDSIKSFFKKLGSQPSTLDVDKRGEGIDEEVLVSVLVLLIEMSSVDDNIDEEETQAVISIVERHFDMPHELTVKYVETALSERERMGKLDPFIDLINSTYNDKQRRLLFALTWKITLADDTIEDDERRLLNQFRARLQVSPEDGEEARKMAESGEV